MLKKLISLILCLSLCLCLVSGALVTKAATINKGIITVDTVEGITGDTVTVPIRIAENPGILAVSISITYDSSVLTYEKFYKGNVITDYMVVDHPTKNLIRLVSLCAWDTTNDDVILTLQFEIANNATMGLHPISIEYSSGDFCNENLDRIMPEIVSGGVNVAYNGSNCEHKKYGDWTEAAAPSCDEKGLKERVCESCGHKDLKDINPVGHEYSNEWTVDKKATPEENGTMSRYCIRCDSYVDRITFPYEKVEEGTVENDLGSKPEDKTYAEEAFKEQNPGKELTPSKQEAKPDDNKSSAEFSDDPDTQTEPDSGEKSDAEVITEEITQKTATVMEKIKEVIPEADKLINIFKIIAVAILYIIFI